MEARMKLVEPEPADYSDQANSGPCPLSVKRSSYYSDFSNEIKAVVGMHSSSQGGPEKPVKIISYLGSLSDRMGQDGDFYVDEMTNILYGPKVGGAWPEEGVSAEGLCKRSWIGLTRARVKPPVPGNAFGRTLRSFLRFLLPLKFLRGIISLRPDREF